MMEARVAGVPSPVSFIASESSFSSSVFPAVSIAVSNVASVKRFGGRVFFFSESMSITSSNWSFARSGGRTCSEGWSSPPLSCFAFFGGESSNTFQPICCPRLPEVW